LGTDSKGENAEALGDRQRHFKGLSGGHKVMGIAEAVDEMTARLSYLRRIGVGYLSLSRSTRSVSGGELQRIHMARSLGSALTATLYCLDEPSAGLHARDSANLLKIIRELRDQGNTVVMVEHERQLIAGADHVIEVGPLAGHKGGAIVFQGDAQSYASNLKAAGQQAKRANQEESSWKDRQTFMVLSGARTHNLKNLEVRFPVGKLTAVCGVSGSGKTSLIQHTLYPLLARALKKPVEKVGEMEPQADAVGPTRTVQAHGDVMLVSQGGMGRSSRSNIATYLGIMDEIRSGLASEPLAQKLGLSAGDFSFNTAGGRCETCRGLGTVVEDLSFLGEMSVICPSCEGRRFTDAVLTVTRQGKNLLDMLAMTVDEARSFFYDRPKVAATLEIVTQMGLGYITLGQMTSSFSGGEAQRLKLLKLMQEVKPDRPSILIFDEPTVGLSDSDVAVLIDQFRLLTSKGHTLIVVEHHLDMLNAADWLVEIGPEAADRGGQLIYEGQPQGVADAPQSVTGPWLYPRKKLASN
jgi:excinuclease ABC subunit A